MNKDILVSIINKNINFFKTIKRRLNRNDYTVHETTLKALQSVNTTLVCKIITKCTAIHDLQYISLIPYSEGTDKVIFIIYKGKTVLGALLYDLI